MVKASWFNDLYFAFSRRGDGQMSFKNGNREEVIFNRERFLRRHRLSLQDVVAGELVHGAAVAWVTDQDKGRGAFSSDWIPGIDGMITREPKVLLLTTHKDCLPILIYDPVQRILGQAHAGWKGLAKGIIRQLVESICAAAPDARERLKVWIGPSIRGCCYAIGPEVAALFPENTLVKWREGWHLDMVKYVMDSLSRLGIAPENVTDCGLCTSCSSSYSSHRRDGVDAPAMALVTGIKPYR